MPWTLVHLALAGLLLPATSWAVPICVGDCDADGVVRVHELLAGVGRSLDEAASARCDAADVDEDGDVAIDELITAVGSALRGCPPRRAEFNARLEAGGSALLLTPPSALGARRVYGVVLTRRVRDPEGRPLRADVAFRQLADLGDPEGEGPVALYDADPEAAGNPYPDARLVQDDGTIHIPNRYALRGLDDRPELGTARGLLRASADEVGMVGGFSTTAPVRIALSAEVDLATVGPGSVLWFERADGALDIEGLLRAARRFGIDRSEVALAFSFPTQPIADDLLAIRDRLADRDDEEFRAVLDDPDPDDDLPIGVFGRESGPYAGFLANNPSVGFVVRGLIPTRDFRGPDGVFDPAKLAGAAPADEVLVDFFLTVPAAPGPHRVVILQHGFAGSNEFALGFAERLAREGLAGIAISALSHGRRGSALELIEKTPAQVRDIFRQTHADLMSLARAVRVGIDLDGDGSSDLVPTNIGYLGVSLGGILGSVFIAVEREIEAAVLNVAGGRVAFLGDNPGTRPIYTGYYSAAAMLDIDSPEFEAFLQRSLELGQQALDPADGLNYAAFWRRAPLPGFAPRRVLMQEGIGDPLVSNAATEELAAAGGLPADVALADPAGVSALWRFDNPGGHSILARGDVQAQAVEFLASGGTSISDPRTPSK